MLLTYLMSTIKLKVDNREHGLIKSIKHYISQDSHFNNIQMSIENLPLGDVIIEEGGEEKILIERKTLNDLESSIKDGRYTEQSYRLDGSTIPNHNIIYLIEGDLTQIKVFKPQMDSMTLYSAMFSLNYYKGFSVLKSNSLHETALIICNMVYKMQKTNKSGYYLTNTNTNTNTILSTEEPCEKDYCKVVKKIKKENVTCENIGEIMLCQIPGISSVTAIAILEKHKTLAQLIQELTQNKECLNDVSYTTDKGQKRKISKTCIKSIIHYLIVKNNTNII